MGTLRISTGPRRGQRRPRLADQIRRWQDNVLDLDVVVDDRRREVDAAALALERAVRDRDDAARYLAFLVTVHAADDHD